MLEDYTFEERAVTILFWIVGGGLILWGFSANGVGFFIPAIILGIVFFMAWGFIIGSMTNSERQKELNAMTPEVRKIYQDSEARFNAERMNIYRYGAINEALICPHCQTKGTVRTTIGDDVTRTKVIPVIGNTIKSRKSVTKMHCDNCRTDWTA